MQAIICLAHICLEKSCPTALPTLFQTPACLRLGCSYTGTMRFLVTLGLACFTFSGGLAQTPRPLPAKATVELQISLPRTLLLPGEPIEVEVAMRNSSGRTLVFSPNDDWLDMDVYSITSRVGDGARVVQFKPVLVEEAFKLESAKAVRTKVDISTAFHLMRPGRYKLTASAGYTGGGGVRAIAEPVIFHITSGAKLWEQEFGVRVEGEGQTETRKYLLQRLTSEKDLRLYATVTDSTGATIIRQVPLGRAAGNDSPQGKLDRLNYLHVLHHTGPRLFTHTVVSPNGELLRRETYESPAGAPRPGLRVEEDGRVTISSAERVPRSDDLPAFQPAPTPAAPLATP